MNERLPKDCALCLKNLESAIGTDVELGFKISCTGTKNKFILMVHDPMHEFGLSHLTSFFELGFIYMYQPITVPALSKLFSAKHPYFLLKDMPFVSMHDFCKKFGLDANLVATEVMKAMRTAFNKTIGYNPNGISFHAVDPSSYGRLSEVHKIIQASDGIASFSEFLVWIDLNVRSK